MKSPESIPSSISKMFQSTSLINQRWNLFCLIKDVIIICFNPHLWLIRDEIEEVKQRYKELASFNPHLWLIRDEIYWVQTEPGNLMSFNPHLWLIRDEISIHLTGTDSTGFQSTSLINQRWNLSLQRKSYVNRSFNPHLWLIRDEIEKSQAVCIEFRSFNPHLWLIRDEIAAVWKDRLSPEFQSTSLINQRWN